MRREFYREVNRLARRGGALEAVDLEPGVQGDVRSSELFRKADFRESSTFARHRDHRVRARDDDRIASLTHSGRDDELDEFVGACAIIAGNYSEGMPAGATRALRCRLHYTAAAAID